MISRITFTKRSETKVYLRPGVSSNRSSLQKQNIRRTRTRSTLRPIGVSLWIKIVFEIACYQQRFIFFDGVTRFRVGLRRFLTRLSELFNVGGSKGCDSFRDLDWRIISSIEERRLHGGLQITIAEIGCSCIIIAKNLQSAGSNAISSMLTCKFIPFLNADCWFSAT